MPANSRWDLIRRLRVNSDCGNDSSGSSGRSLSNSSSSSSSSDNDDGSSRESSPLPFRTKELVLYRREY